MYANEAHAIAYMSDDNYGLKNIFNDIQEAANRGMFYVKVEPNIMSERMVTTLRGTYRYNVEAEISGHSGLTHYKISWGSNVS